MRPTPFSLISPLVRCGALAAFGLVALSSCRQGADSEPSEALASSESSIINGALDTTRDAVVRLTMQSGNRGSRCSGAIIKTDPAEKLGWVLTAAHCVNDLPPVVVVQGPDADAPDAVRYRVLDYAFDTRYTSTTAPYDVAIVRFAGADATTPILPIASAQDGLSYNSAIFAVGYGRTTLNATGLPGDTRMRRAVTLDIAGIYSKQIRYDQTLGGFCQGDSGGPNLLLQGGTETIIGVTSYVENDCNTYSVSGRVASNLPFIEAQTEKAPPAFDCTRCSKTYRSGRNVCAELSRACALNSDCAALTKCIGECSDAAACKDACFQKYPNAEGPYRAADDCDCARTCATECATDPGCVNVPRCGYAFAIDSCGTCTQASCCQEALDCAAEGECFRCLKTGNADPSCGSNVLRQKLTACGVSKCTACAPPVADDAGASGPADAASPEASADASSRPAPSTEAAADGEASGCSVTSRPNSRAREQASSTLSLVLLVTPLAIALRRRRKRIRVERVSLLRRGSL
jgi:hypothetical protein